MRWFILTIDLGMKPLLKQGDRTDCQNLDLSWPVARFWGCPIVPLSWWTWKSCPVGNPSPNQTNKQKDADTPIGSFIDIYLELVKNWILCLGCFLPCTTPSPHPKYFKKWNQGIFCPISHFSWNFWNLSYGCLWWFGR